MLVSGLFKRHRQLKPQEVVERLTSYGVSHEHAERLAQYLGSAPERELYRLNVRYLAERLSLPVRSTFIILAAALVAGVVKLDWEVRCPACGGQSPAFASLSEARSRQSCDACGSVFDAHLDEEVLVTFTVSELIRPLGPGADDPLWRLQIDQRYGRISGHDLLTVQSFRDLFVKEPLPGGESFEVRRMTLLFTDLGGSTALYARKGDPRAYGLVREHFDLLLRAIDEAGGAVVKTIGDAIMAVFPLSDGALRAGLEGQRAIAAFNRQRALSKDEALLLKAGIHSGPCLAVTLNGRLDYFGTTVNAAARVEKLARPGEVIFTAQARSELIDQSLLDDLPLVEEQIMLRGLRNQSFTIYRTWLN